MTIPQSIKKHALNYGGLYGVFAVLMLIIVETYDLKSNPIISALSLIVPAAIVVMSVLHFKKENNQQLELSEALKLGLAIGVVGGLIYAIYMYIHYTSINPDFIEEIKESAQLEFERLVEKDNLKGEELENAKQGMFMMTTPFAIATFTLFTQLIKAFIFSLVIGLISKNKTS
ncbi:MAG: DUF4199 domain-containing protein [Bacteroidota bacterium]